MTLSKQIILNIAINVLFLHQITAQMDSLLPTAEISASRFQRFSVGQTRLVVDSFDLKNFNQQSIAELLSATTPLSIKSYGATSSATVALRGTSASHTALLWNGFDLRSSMSGLSDLSILPTIFEHIEVKNGGGSALFGAGAVGGAIYFDSDIPQKQGIHAHAHATVGSFGLTGQALDFSIGKKDKVAFDARFSQSAAANDFPFLNVASIGKPTQRQVNAASENQHFLSNLFLQVTENQTLKASFWHQNADRQIPPTMTTRTDSARQNDAADRLTAEWSLAASPKLSVKTRAAFFSEKLNYASLTVAESRNAMKNFVAEAEVLRDFSSFGTARLGINFTKQIVESSNFADTKSRRRIAVFGSQTIDFQQFKAVINLRQELADGKLTPFTFNIGAEQSLKSKIFSLKSDWILRGSVARNYNLPALNDLYWATLGNPNLQAESGWSQEIGADWTVGKKTASVTFFNLNVDNWIQWSPAADGIWRPSNLKNVWSRGIEAQVKTVFLIKQIVLKPQIGYQLTRVSDDVYLNKQLIYVPIHSVSANIRWIFKDFNGGFSQTYSSQRFASFDNSTFADGFTVGNIWAGGRIVLGKFSVNGLLKIQNIWNADYQVLPFYANPKRHFLAEISFGF